MKTPAKLDSRSNFFLPFFNRHYAWLLAIAAFAVMGLNFHSRSMSGVFPAYLEFRSLILSGFSPLLPHPTFPLWGYGWVLALTQNRLVLFVVQMSLAVLCTSYFFRCLEENGTLDIWFLTFLKILVLCSVYWFAFHAVLWPYSLATCLFVFAFLILVKTMSSPTDIPLKPILWSSILYGLSLQFRSEQLLLGLGLSVVILVWRGFRRPVLKRLLQWLCVAYLMLLPWMFYTYRAIGHPLVTSTNAGAVFYIGLGQLPNNPWGITPVDEDPKLHEELAQNLGPVSFTCYEADVFLKKSFLNKVKSAPLVYIKKVAFAVWLVMTDGFYRGEFYEENRCEPNCEDAFRTRRSLFLHSPFGYGFSHWRESSFYRMLIQIIFGVFSRILSFISVCLLPIVIIHSVKEKNLFVILTSLCLCYSILIEILACHKSSTMTTFYLFHMLNIIVGVHWIWHWLSVNRQPSQLGK